MTRDEIVTALRCYGGDSCEGCPYIETFAVDDEKCIGEAMGIAADLIENQQRHIEALMKANDSLKDAIARRDKQIEDMGKDRKDMHNELCGRCGLYLNEHNGACDGCRWRGV